MRCLTSSLIVALVLSFAVACSEPTAVQSRLRPNDRGSVRYTSTKPALYPNTRKYRDAGAKPAVGRSGSAAVQMRALLGISGTTDVELTTGSFDGAVTASGSLAMAQVKSLANGASFTSNQPGLTSSAASFPYKGVAHGTPVNVQAIVRSVDGARSDVVNVADIVHFRPDLYAEIEGPAGAPVGGAINFFATVGERLGELGARASCVAYVDGTEIDRADNVWIDADSWVGCMFTVTFATKGIHKVEIRVENVKPGDFDNSNNRASMTVHVEEPTGYAAYGFQAHDYTVNDSFRFVSLWNGVLTDQRETDTGREQFISFVGLIPQALEFPIRVRGQYATNGATIDVTDETFDSAPFVDWQPGYCDSHYSFADGTGTYICVYTGGYLAGQTVVQHDWSHQDIRYHSEMYSKVWGDDTSEPSYQVNDYGRSMPLITFGPDVTGELTIYSGASPTPVASATKTISFYPDVLRLDLVDPSCTPDLFPPLTCFESHWLLSGNFAYTDFGSWPQYTP